jgi:transcription elongation factor SPT6
MTTCIFENAAGFLRISQNPESRLEKHRTVDELDLPDPLDDTRIHPADYELARKMAADALDLDEEDIQDEHSSYVVLQIKEAADGARRLDELNLDDFAINMFRDNGDRKRHTLNTIRDELLRPSADRRPPYALPSDWDVLTMLSSETPRTLRVGLIVSVAVTRNLPHYVEVKLDSGLSGMINIQYLVDQAPSSGDTRDIVKRGQTLLGVIIDVKLDLLNDMFGLELSSRESDVSVGDANFRKVAIDEDFYDVSQAEKDKELLQRRKRSENDRTRRVIKHPNFHNFNSIQAEAYLAAQQRGDAIVRPSSKGADHLAVTWKVDEGLYQHIGTVIQTMFYLLLIPKIDVLDPNADVTKQTVGQRLIVDNGEHEFADLDELIVNYVQALARRVEELMSHEKYKRGSDEAIRARMFLAKRDGQLTLVSGKELNDYITANPSKSIYCFTLNRRRPGHFNIVFKANPASPVQVWVGRSRFLGFLYCHILILHPARSSHSTSLPVVRCYYSFRPRTV